MFWIAHAVGHFTLLAVLGFFVLVVASKASGGLGLLGKLLGAWLYALALVVLVVGIVAPLAGWNVFGGMGPWHRAGMMRWGHPRWEVPAAQPAQPESPAAPAPASPGSAP